MEYYATPGIFIPQSTLLRFKLADLDSNNPNSWYNKVRIPMKKLTNYSFDNGVLYWTNIYGDVFTILVSRNKTNIGDRWSIGVWNFVGTDSICSYGKQVTDLEETFPKDFYKEMVSKCDEYTRGIIHCSDCGTVMLKNEPQGKFAKYGGRYFAGRYCHTCWTTKGYKEREAKETYE